MERTAKYRRLLSRDDIPIDAVCIRVIEKDGRTLAEVEWPENHFTIKGDYFYPTPVPLAIERALDVKDNYGFREVVVIIDNDQLWDDAWGSLI
ncbi:hypothetical protein J2X72_005050 [Phyllobacterium sp. 1468]|uniref:hypothetical protein n=1 Tax=Phyllobacterium sp. 1468 TaxID=2817759 RepID=UPI001AE39338|nr:hypothetical protein [Phyllobacterium sp. 1468]MDR6636236.1 hypothetical protein [Phyllobacterium sp. 1468]